MERKPNAAQQEVIRELERNILLYAGAGTGKTFTVANRIRHILEQKKAAPEEILCVTFTVKACGEMTEDIRAYVGREAEAVKISTIHGFGLSFLREEARRKNSCYADITPCDETDEQDILYRLITDHTVRREPDSSPEYDLLQKKPEALSGIVSKIKHARYWYGIFSDNREADYREVIRRLESEQCLANLFLWYLPKTGEQCDKKLYSFFLNYGGSLLNRYDSFLEECDLADFDDLILLTARALREPETRKYWRNKFRYIVIDEMQDTSTAEYDVLEPLFEGNHVMLCGDYSQTIYEWRGSRPEIVLNSYREQYQAKVCMFSENYRSTRILAAASFGYLRNAFPGLDGSHCPDTLEIHSGTEGDKILVCACPDEYSEAKLIYRYLLKNRSEASEDICIMARSNRYIAELYDRLQTVGKGLPEGDRFSFFTVEKGHSFFRTPVVKDLLAFLRILLNRSDSASLERIAEKYINGVGRTTLSVLREAGCTGVSVCSFLEQETYRDGDCYAALLRAAKEETIVVYDTETTGLDLERDQVIQLAAIRYDRNGIPADSFNRIVIPTVEVSQGARDTVPFDVDREIRLNGQPAAEVFRDFSEFVRGSVLVGHNSSRFDALLLRRQLRELGLPEPDVVEEYDTLTLARQFYPGLENYKLATLCSTFGIVNEDAHNAFGDVKATGEVLFYLLRNDLLPSETERRKLLAKYSKSFEKINSYISHLQEYLESGDVSGLFKDIIETCKLRTRYKTETAANAVADLERLVAARKTENAEEFLQTFVSDAALSGSQLDSMIRKLGQIPIISVHASKGCEFGTVILAGCDSSHFPSAAAVKTGSTEEEKRIFYVAVSRAKLKLVITYCEDGENSRRWPPRHESPLIEKIPQQYLRRIRLQMKSRSAPDSI